MKYVITKLDGRHSGADYFSHYVTCDVPGYDSTYSSRYINYNIFREWCVSTWGMTCERDIYVYLKQKILIDYKLNDFWAWHNYNSQRRIYLTERGKVWFDLSCQ